MINVARVKTTSGNSSRYKVRVVRTLPSLLSSNVIVLAASAGKCFVFSYSAGTHRVTSIENFIVKVTSAGCSTSGYPMQKKTPVCD